MIFDRPNVSIFQGFFVVNVKGAIRGSSFYVEYNEIWSSISLNGTSQQFFGFCFGDKWILGMKSGVLLRIWSDFMRGGSQNPFISFSRSKIGIFSEFYMHSLKNFWFKTNFGLKSSILFRAIKYLMNEVLASFLKFFS